MTGSPVFNQVNIVARDWEASLAFYRLLGLPLASGVTDWPPGSGGSHVGVETSATSTSVEFDNPQLFRIYATPELQTPLILGFGYPSSEDVDAACERVKSAGHTVIRAPHDAFWGARYALVQDPDGNTIGLMGPRDRSRSYTPEAPSADR
jgi:catechol 2,3-dioxygenase-like lactoylglutathione lyase family enzyme